MSLKKITHNLLGELRDSIGKQGLNGRKDIGTLALSTESMDDASRSSAVAARDTLEDVIASSIDLVLGNESAAMVLTSAQRDAARQIASLAIDPAAGMQAIANGSAPKASSGALSVEAQDLGITDLADATSLSTEAFDGQSMNNAMYFSIAYNLFAAKQDAFGETFFPTISIDPAMSGAIVSTEVTSLYQNFDRLNDGSANRAKFKKITLAKAIYDNNLFGGDRNKAVPVSRAASAANLIPALAYVDTSTGANITTAPLAIGKEINLLGISQTDAMLAKGSMDAFDSLDRTINLKSVIISLQATLAGVSTTEHFRVPVGMLPGSNFTYTTQGHDKDLNLSFDSVDVAFLTSSTVTIDGTTSAILASLPAGHRVKIHLKVTGDGNTQYGDVAVYATVAAVDSILDAAGTSLVSTAADYVTIDGVFTSMAVEGYELDAYLTNSNLRKEGQLVTIDRFEQVYNVPVRSGVSVVMPINSGANDDSRLVGQVQATGFRTSLEAVNTLVSFTDNLGILTSNGANTDITLMGVGRHHVDAYFSDAVLDMALIVDSESSASRNEDICAALIGRIRNEVQLAYVQSKYNTAHAMIRGNNEAPVGVIIGTSARVKSYLCGSGDDTIELGGNFVAKVVATPNVGVGDNMYITFSDHASTTRNSEVDPSSFGTCFWAPTITSDVAKTVNGATVRSFQTFPRFIHIVNLPIMIRLNVTNLNSVLGKIAQNRHTV